MKKLNVKLPQGGSKRALHSGMYASALAVVWGPAPMVAVSARPSKK